MNVTYIFGAGASFGALPLVKDIPEDLKAFARDINDAVEMGDVKRDQVTSLLNDIYWLHDETLKSSSVDTFAKRLSLRGEKEKLNKLKTVLTLFFVYKQANSKFSEKRYDAFFASILNDSYGNLPKSIKIFSWNYDSQFELAFNEYSQLNSLRANQEKLRVFNKLLKNDSSTIDKRKFAIFKLNGTAAFFKENDLVDLLFEPNAGSPGFIAEYYSKIGLDKDIFQAISFAWEKVPEKESHLTTGAKDCVSDTDILVIIGYSFPDFNRDIDSEILNSMANVEKIIIQDVRPLPIKDKLIAARRDFGYTNTNVQIVLHHDVSSFFIPHEYKKSLY